MRIFKYRRLALTGVAVAGLGAVLLAGTTFGDGVLPGSPESVSAQQVPGTCPALGADGTLDIDAMRAQMEAMHGAGSFETMWATMQALHGGSHGPSMMPGGMPGGFTPGGYQ